MHLLRDGDWAAAFSRFHRRRPAWTHLQDTWYTYGTHVEGCYSVAGLQVTCLLFCAVFENRT